MGAPERIRAPDPRSRLLRDSCATSDMAPSVVQLRMQALLSERAVETIVTAVNAHAKDIELGALISIDESSARVRILPFRQP